MKRRSAERLENGTWRVRCRTCGTAFVASSPVAAYCSETCAMLAPRNRDPERTRLVKPIAADRERRRRLRLALKAALADPDGYASGLLRIPAIGRTKGQRKDASRRAFKRILAAGRKTVAPAGLAKAAFRLALRRRRPRR